ncbi:MAG: antibiotic biosynthesis monooxygenase [Candidatus Zixiibacteriota bacterium]
MIVRIWHGWTTPENADAYETLLLNKVIPGIEVMNIEGYRSIKVFRRPLESEVEFITMMYFDSLESVRNFMGEDYSVAHVPPKARAVLSHFDERSQHYEVRAEFDY